MRDHTDSASSDECKKNLRFNDGLANSDGGERASGEANLVNSRHGQYTSVEMKNDSASRKNLPRNGRRYDSVPRLEDFKRDVS